ncbi:hypothetical protein ACGF8B_00640 [Streptomyces sp. NPDC047917]|uniref:hypothetical protein n=1 Tax=Streptomyces sp. NPDC047917 TaxID=3365491 RepID=UPI00370FE09D
MKSALQTEIESIRERLDQLPDGIAFADFPPGARRDLASGNSLPGNLDALLEASDGPRCQAIMIYPSDFVQGIQYLCEEFEGGADKWFCFGHVEDNPLLIESTSGHVYQFPHPVQEWRISDRLECLSESVPEFFTRYALGDDYLILSRRSDRWYEFISSLNQNN